MPRKQSEMHSEKLQTSEHLGVLIIGEHDWSDCKCLFGRRISLEKEQIG